MSTPSMVDSEKDVASTNYTSEDGHAGHTTTFVPDLTVVDEGFEEYAQNIEGQPERSPEEQKIWDAKSKSIARKFDWRLLPLMCCLVGINYIDKAAIAWAVLFGFSTDLGLVGKDYSWVSSIFYFGYLAGQIPSVWLTARAPLGKVIGVTTICWGVLMLGTMGCKTYGQMLAVRFLLGVFEAPIVPAMVSYTALFYTRQEGTARTLIWGAMQGSFYLVFSLVAYGLGHIANDSLRQWAWIFLVLGLLSIVLGTCWIFFMPDTPMKAKWLDDEQKGLAVERVASNMAGTKGHKVQLYQVWETLMDPMYYLILLFTFATTVPNGISSFNTLVVSSFGFDQFNTLLVALPSSIVSAGSLLTWSVLARRYGGLRTLGMSLPLIPAIAGIASVYATTYGDYSKWGRVFAYWLNNSYAVCFPFLEAFLGSNFAGHTKRAFVYGSVLVFFATGNIVGPFIFPTGASNYSTAFAVLLVFYCVQILIVGVIALYIIWFNRRRDTKYGPVDRKLAAKGALEGMMDKTDGENTSFRYVL